MKRFKFRLATLLRLREATRDERRAHLAEALAAERTLAERKASLLAEIDTLRQTYGRRGSVGTVDVDRLLDANRFQLVVQAEIANVDAQSAQLAPEIERRRQALVVADRDVRVLERLRETWQDRHRQQEAVAEMKQSDEMASRKYAEPMAIEGAV